MTPQQQEIARRSGAADVIARLRAALRHASEATDSQDWARVATLLNLALESINSSSLTQTHPRSTPHHD